MARSDADPRPGAPRAAPSKSPARRWLLTPWPGVLLALLVYANSLGNDFTYDDNSIIRANPRIRSLTQFHEIWLKDWWADPTEETPLLDPARDRLYRPLTLYSFALNYAVGGLNPLGYHAVNLALHALVSGLVFAFTRRWLGDPRVALAASLLFAVHPVHAEAVAGVVGRAEIMAALFLLLGLLVLWARAPARADAAPPARAAAAPRADDWGIAAPNPTLGATAAAAALFLLALLSKETAVCYPAIALLVLWDRRGAARGVGWWTARTAILLAPLLLYFPLRFAALEARLVRDRLVSGLFNPLNDAPLGERIGGAFTILGHYTRLTFAPSRLSSDYGLAIVNPPAGPDAMTLLGAISAIGLLLLLAPLVRAALRGGPAGARPEAARPGVALGLLAAMFLASYALISNTLLLIGVSLAERLFYWPSVPVLIGIALAAVGFWERAVRSPQPERRRLAGLLQWLAVLLIVGLGARAGVRASDWSNDGALFTADATANPDGAHLNCNLGRIHLAAAQRAKDPRLAALHLQTAEAALRRALRVAPRFPQALQYLGAVHALRGENDQARECFERALVLQPGNSIAQAELARLRGTADADQARLEALRARSATQPADAATRIELGRVLIALGKNFDALGEFQAAADSAPDNVEALRGLADALILNLQRDEAATVLKKLVALAPDDWQAHTNLTTLLHERDPGAALHHARRALELKPDDLRIQINFAEALALSGDTPEALKRLRAIERALPADSVWRPILADRIHDLATRGP